MTSIDDQLIILPQKFAKEITDHAIKEYPNECCGILAGTKNQFLQLFRMTNVESSPYRFSWDPKELFKAWNTMEDNQWEHRAVYHSHTHSQAYPSDTDVRLAAWPDAFYLIISLADKENPVIRIFQILDGKISEKRMITQ
tara:strand:- start:63 stop:482 length:420 start_codon:yes stop_codon:yes gene_type:complete